MKIAVMGAGAVGCYYGAMLAQAGHDVTLIGRPAHIEAIRRHGLVLDKQGEQIAVPLRASTEPDAVQGAEIVLFCVKLTDTDSAAQAIAPYLAPQAAILTLQNGVDSAERLQAALGRAVTPSVVYVAVEMADPGQVKHHGRGELILGAAAGSASIAASFTAAGIPTTVSDNPAGDLWNKLIVNCAYNALSALAQKPYGELVRTPGVPTVIRDVVRECLAVAKRIGVPIADDIETTVTQIAISMPSQYSSTAQDLARGKVTEIDHLNGYVARKGDELGIDTPVNRVLCTAIKLLEARQPSYCPP